MLWAYLLVPEVRSLPTVLVIEVSLTDDHRQWERRLRSLMKFLAMGADMRSMRSCGAWLLVLEVEGILMSEPLRQLTAPHISKRFK